MKKAPISLAIADDHAIVRRGIIAQLKAYKHIQIVLEATNGEELISQLQHARKLPDICLLDISMQPMNGYETAAAIREKWPEIKVMALSMFDDEYCIINMLRSGARGYLTKACEPGQLVYALEQLHEKGCYHGEIDPNLLLKAIQGDKSIPQLTDKEKEFLFHCCSDKHYNQIAEQMNASQRTVETYRDSLFRKLNIKTRSGLATFAMLTGLGPVLSPARTR